jgi:hypothetical protein
MQSIASTHSSSALSPRDLCDDATCTVCCRSSSSFDAKLGNPTSTYFTTKQAAKCRHMSSHCFRPLIGFEAQNAKPPPTWF